MVEEACHCDESKQFQHLSDKIIKVSATLSMPDVNSEVFGVTSSTKYMFAFFSDGCKQSKKMGWKYFDKGGGKSLSS